MNVNPAHAPEPLGQPGAHLRDMVSSKSGPAQDDPVGMVATASSPLVGGGFQGKEELPKGPKKMQLAMGAKAQAQELQRRAALEPRLEKELCKGPTSPAAKQQARQQYEPGKSCLGQHAHQSVSQPLLTKISISYQQTYNYRQGTIQVLCC